MRKTVIECDLVAYSDIARVLDESVGPAAVASLNDQIQSFIDEALATIGLTRRTTVVLFTGDGAILLFDRADDGHHFAKNLHNVTSLHNQTLHLPSSKRWFRSGGATGEIAVRGRDIAGVKIADAVRLETASSPGNFLIDVATFESLSKSLRVEYGPEEKVAGKRNEVIRAHRCTFISVPPEDLGWRVGIDRTGGLQHEELRGRRDIIRLFDKLYPEEKLEQLIFLLEMPLDMQPSRTLSLAARRVEVLRWASSELGPGIDTLESELRFLLEAE